MKVDWTDTALAHLGAIHDYIARDSPRYAVAVVDQITRRSQQCGRFPLIGAKVPECNAEDVREVLAYPYRIIYRVFADRVEILAVIHGARQMPPKLP